MRYLFALGLLLPGLAAGEIFKCVSETGATTYADQPCGPDPQEFRIQTYDPPGDGSAGRVEARKSLRATQRYISLQNVEREIRESRTLIERYRDRMETELGNLRFSQRFSNNNLAGATRDVGIAQEMKAVTQKYQSLIAIEQAELDRLFERRMLLLGVGGSIETRNGVSR